MREKFIRFMNGRNGMDELARAEVMGSNDITCGFNIYKVGDT